MVEPFNGKLKTVCKAPVICEQTDRGRTRNKVSSTDHYFQITLTHPIYKTTQRPKSMISIAALI